MILVAKHSKFLARKLEKFGFIKIREKKHHIYYAYRTLNGEILPQVYTYLSHAGKDYGNKLLSDMSDQVKLTKQEFLNLLDDKMTREEYEEILLSKGFIK